jgi:hypothetical protein
MFNSTKQYRCTIIRGKAQTELDDLLLTYASIISEITPLDKESYNQQFNDSLSFHFFKKGYYQLSDDNKKTIRNHITEIAEKLFALSYIDESNTVFASDSCEKILEDNDQPAFFKSLCFNFQQPNGTQKIQTIEEKISNEISSRPLHIVLAVLLEGLNRNTQITKTDIAFYVLNSLEVLQGKVSPKEIVDTIIEEKSKGMVTEFDWSSSRDSQHIREQLNLLVLANLIKIDGQNIYLNLREMSLINTFCEQIPKPLNIDYNNFNLADIEDRRRFYFEWNKYNGAVNIIDPEYFSTTIESLGFWQDSQIGQSHTVISKTQTSSTNLNEIGNEGEFIVLEFEKNRVGNYNHRLVNKVIHVGGTKGLGYDISSVEADELPTDPEFARYIEVKTTKRATSPDFQSANWFDSVNLTKREWIVARQFGSAFNIYRVYLTPFGNKIVKLNNPYLKYENNLLNVQPMIYRMDFENRAIDKHYR